MSSHLADRVPAENSRCDSGPRRAVHASILPPEGESFSPASANLSVAPDGQQVSFVASAVGGRTLLWPDSVHELTRSMTSHIIHLRRCDMAAWKLHEAKARFSELLDTTIRNGPQVLTRRGVEAAVLVPIDEWHRLQRAARPGLKALLLGPGPRFEDLIPPRRAPRRRRPVRLK